MKESINIKRGRLTIPWYTYHSLAIYLGKTVVNRKIGFYNDIISRPFYCLILSIVITRFCAYQLILAVTLVYILKSVFGPLKKLINSFS